MIEDLRMKKNEVIDGIYDGYLWLLHLGDFHRKCGVLQLSALTDRAGRMRSLKQSAAEDRRSGP